MKRESKHGLENGFALHGQRFYFLAHMSLFFGEECLQLSDFVDALIVHRTKGIHNLNVMGG